MSKKGPEEETQQFHSDEELKERLAKEVRDNPASLPSFKYVVMKYQSKSYGLAIRIIKQHENAEEAVQDAFVDAYSALKSYTPERIREMRLQAWLLRIVINKAFKYWKKEKARQGQQTSLEASEPGVLDRILLQQSVDVEDQAEFHEKVEAFMKAFKALSEDERLAFYMKIELDLTHKEISSILDTSEGNIKSRISRGREKLREQLGNDYPEYFDR